MLKNPKCMEYTRTNPPTNPYLPYKSTYIYHTYGGKHTSPTDAICLGWWIHYEFTYNFFSWLVLTGKDGWRSIGFLDSTWVFPRKCCKNDRLFLFFVIEVWKGFVCFILLMATRNLAFTIEVGSLSELFTGFFYIEGSCMIFSINIMFWVWKIVRHI